MHDFNKVRSVLEMFYRKEKGSVNLPLVEMHFILLFLPLYLLEAQG